MLEFELDKFRNRVGNNGDSRAVLGTRDQDDSHIAVQLTVDLKPNLLGMSLVYIVKVIHFF